MIDREMKRTRDEETKWAQTMRTPSLRLSVSPSLRPGFSFTEVMFAVIILGIGFIMVAAIFPVAIQQAKNTTEETTAAAIARGAANYAEQILRDGADPANTSNTKPGGVVSPALSPVSQLSTADYPAGTITYRSQWNAVRGNLILPEDPRYGFVLLYRRAGVLATPAEWKPYAQVYVFPVQCRAKTVFSQADVTLANNPFDPANHPVANLMARPVQVAVANDVAVAGGADLIAFDVSMAGIKHDNVIGTNGTGAPVEGAYVVIADDKITGASKGRMNGRVFKLGGRRIDFDNAAIFTSTSQSVVYELQPGSDFTPDPGADGVLAPGGGAKAADDVTAVGMNCLSPSNVSVTATADAYVIGRGYADPSDLSKGYAAGAMPLGVYTTFINVSQ